PVEVGAIAQARSGGGAVGGEQIHDLVPEPSLRFEGPPQNPIPTVTPGDEHARASLRRAGPDCRIEPMNGSRCDLPDGGETGSVAAAQTLDESAGLARPDQERPARCVLE